MNESATTRAGSVRRQEIFQIATEIFYQKGYAHTSTRDIAAAAGILKGSLYAHVSSKEDFLYAIIQDVHRRFAANMVATGDLQAFVRGHMRAALSELKHHQIYMNDWRSLSEDRYRAIRQTRNEYEQHLAALLTRAQATGEVRLDIPSHLLAKSLLSALNSVHVWYHPGGAYSEAAVADAYCSLVLEGVVNRR